MLNNEPIVHIICKTIRTNKKYKSKMDALILKPSNAMLDHLIVESFNTVMSPDKLSYSMLKYVRSYASDFISKKRKQKGFEDVY